MKKTILFLSLILCFSIDIVGQINMQDSSVQVVGYWNKNEMQSYTITDEKYKVQNGDTTAREFYKYDVDITIIDSTANSYTIEWKYKNFDVKADNKLIEKLSKDVRLTKAIFKTNELGTFQELVNWKEISDEVKRLISAVEQEYKNVPNIDKLFQQMLTIYSSKEAIENNAINEIQQFYSFHGGKYKIGEDIQTSIKTPNNYGGEPIDSEVEIWLDELNPDDENYILRMSQIADSTQLLNATYDYLSKMSSTLGVESIKKDDLPAIKHQTLTASRMHNTGWLVYSIVDKLIESDNIQKIEQQIIEIK